MQGKEQYQENQFNNFQLSGRVITTNNTRNIEIV